MSPRLLLSVLLLLLCGRAAPAAPSGSEDEDDCSPARFADPFTKVIVATEGPNALIECNVTRGHAHVKWFSPQGAELGGEAGEKWRIEENGALNISAVTYNDRGRYTCVYTSDGGVTKNDTVTLCVGYCVITVTEGSNDLLECKKCRGPTVKWFSPQGAELGGGAGEKWRIEENGALNISAVSFKDSGRYTCVTTSDDGVTRTYSVGLCVLDSFSYLDLYYVTVYHLIPWCLDLLLVLTFLYYSYKHFYIFLIGAFLIYLKDEILGPEQFIASTA